jgi:molybdate transport system permease protein
MKTEVLPTSVWLELSVGNLEAAIAVSMVMVVLAIVVLASVRLMGERL